MSSNGTDTAPPSSSPPPPPSSTPVDVPSSTPTPEEPDEPDEPSSTQAPPPSSTPDDDDPSSSNTPPPDTRVITASSRPPSTQVITSVVTPTPTQPGESVAPSTVVITVSGTDAPVSLPTGAESSSSAAPTDSSGATLADLENGGGSGSDGLSEPGRIAIAVVVPVVVVGALVFAGIFFWRRRKQKKNAEDARRKEVEEYGFNPNNDPTLPAVGLQSEMAEDQSGYRGWGNTTTSSNRKASTTLTSGMTYSDSNSNPGGYQSPGSPTHGTYSDGHSGDPLMNGRRETMDSEGIGALGAAPNASHNQNSVHRGPSNASSSYSAANHSDGSGEYPLPNSGPDYYGENGYYQSTAYGGNGFGDGSQPIIRDVSARRNTRIENPSILPQQGNSGISQNF